MNTKQQVLEFLKGLPDLQQSKKISGNYHTYFYPKGPYLLSHGEYERPEYFIQKYKDGYGVRAVYFYYPNTINAPDNGRIDLHHLQDMYSGII